MKPWFQPGLNRIVGQSDDRVHVRLGRLALAGLFVLVAVYVLDGRAQENPPRLLADVGGPIGSAVISVNSARRAALRNAALISNIVNSLDARIQFGIVTNDRRAFTVASNPWPDRIEFLEMDAATPITIWTQDPFLVLVSDLGESTLLLPWSSIDPATVPCRA